MVRVRLGPCAAWPGPDFRSIIKAAAWRFAYKLGPRTASPVRGPAAAPLWRHTATALPQTSVENAARASEDLFWDDDYLMLRSNASGAEIGLPGRMSAGLYRASGPDVGRILIGKTSKSALRSAFGRPEIIFQAFPTRIRPKSGAEARCPAQKH